MVLQTLPFRWWHAMSANVVPFSRESVSHTLISRLTRVTQVQPGRWRAVCPSHDSTRRTQSLAIRELPDGTLLLKCHAGCGAADIVGALGLQLRDLFPTTGGEPRKSGKPNHWHSMREAMQTLHKEVLICAIAADNAARGEPLTEQDAERVALAAGRIRAAIEACL